MTVELRPLGVLCNLACQYCYQNPQRDAGNVANRYNMDAMMSALELENSAFTIFGGEPLLVPVPDLERAWKWGYERFKQNGIQTNGALITDEHIRLFKQYGVQVGISLDGPGELNDVRWAGTLEKTRELTAKTESNIAKLCSEKVFPSLIVTLHRGNAIGDRLPILLDWLRGIDRLGVTSARLHILESENEVIRKKYGLSVDENIHAFLACEALQKELSGLRFDLFVDMESLLMATDGQATCVWRACDPYTTSAVRGIEGFGQRSNCGRTNKEGIDFRKADVAGYERYVALFNTPQEYGGCSGCRFFLMCKGQCPGTSMNGDWRSRTEHCEVWKALFRRLEDNLLDSGRAPLTVRSTLRKRVEEAMMADWSRGVNSSYRDHVVRLQEPEAEAAMRSGSPTPIGAAGGGHGDSHGDHTDARRPGHGDHGDHGDHTDSSRRAIVSPLTVASEEAEVHS